jgi:uncharacterized transporter YbjL
LFKALLTRLGNDPQKSWADFKIGLGLFLLAVILILAGARFFYWLQVPGLVCLVIALYYSAKGYVGIFAHRFSRSLNALKAPSAEDK